MWYIILLQLQNIMSDNSFVLDDYLWSVMHVCSCVQDKFWISTKSRMLVDNIQQSF